MTQEKYEQLDKLVRTLLVSGLESTSANAMKKAKEMLKITDPPQKIDATKLPKVDDLTPVTYSSGISDLDSDKTLKEVVEEDAKKIYDKKTSE